MKVRKWVSILNSSEKTGKPGKTNEKKCRRAVDSNWEKGSDASALPTEPAGIYFEVFRSCIYFGDFCVSEKVLV